MKSVTYVDTRNGEEYEQPAGFVILGAYVFNNMLLMLVSGIGKPYDRSRARASVGKNYCYQYTGAGVTLFFEDKEMNPFMAAGAFGTIMDDFNGDNFDHSGLGFIGGGHISAGPPTAVRSRRAPRRLAPRAGARAGNRPPPNGTATGSMSAARRAITPIATIISISTPTIRMRWGGR